MNVQDGSDEIVIPVTFFVGLCYYCNAPDSQDQPLKRCGGCHLVAYCSKECQMKNRYKHKYVCKEFPVVDDKNVLHTKGPWVKHREGLRQRAARLPHNNWAQLVFYNPRICHTCKEARQTLLKDCKCASVSYCSKKCRKKDKTHKEACMVFDQICDSYSSKYLDDQSERSNLGKYPFTLFYALKSLGKRCIGRDHSVLEDLTSLDIHVIANNPLFYHEPWEDLLHEFPKLERLNLVFVMQGSAIESSYKPNFKLSGLSLFRCRDCETKDHLITYSLQQMVYHMYFSSPQYTDPDVVIVYGNTQEMLAGSNYNVNSKISYRNMTYNSDTILILTDDTKELVKQGVRAVNAAQPVDQLGAPKKNPLGGFRSNQAAMNSSDNLYFTCLQRSLEI